MDAAPYQLALSEWNRFRGYESKGKTNLERLEDSELKKQFIQTLTGDQFAKAMQEWESEYQELVNEDNRLRNRYRDLYVEYRGKAPKALQDLPGWEQKLNPTAIDMHEWEKEKLATGKVVVGWRQD